MIGSTTKRAVISDCGRYRYALWRRWGEGEQVCWIMLNPSTADAVNDDPTIHRCIGFAKAWGYGGIAVGNLFAWRDTHPRNMKAVGLAAVGPENDEWLKRLAAESAVVVAAWSVHGDHLDRDQQVKQLLPNLTALRLTRGGHPSHPLYLPGTCRPVSFHQLPLVQGKDAVWGT